MGRRRWGHICEPLSFNCYGRIAHWVRANGLMIEATKTEAIMLVGRRRIPELRLEEHSCWTSMHVKYLGIWLLYAPRKGAGRQGQCGPQHTHGDPGEHPGTWTSGEENHRRRGHVYTMAGRHGPRASPGSSGRSSRVCKGGWRCGSLEATALCPLMPP